MSVQTPPTSRSGDAYGRFSIRSYLLLLIAAILAPMLALAGVLAWHYGVAARQTIEAQRLDVANNLTNLIDREIGSMAGFLSGLSISPAFRSGDPHFLETITQLVRERGFEVLGVYDRNGRLLFALPADRRLSMPAAEAARIAETVASGKPMVSELQAGVDAKPGLFFISVPATVDGQGALVVTGGVAPRRLQGLFAEAGLREGWRAGIVDRTGVILARSLDPERYVGRLAQRPMVEAARGAQLSGLFDVVSREGVDIRNSFQRSTFTGWTAGVAVPASVVNAPLWWTTIILAAISLCFTLFSLLLGALVASRITHAVYLLGRAVLAFVTGEPVSLPTATLFELRDVLRVVEATAAMGRKDAHLQRP